MGGRSLSLLLVAGALVLAACGEQPSDAPTSPEFKAGPPGSCSFTNVSDLTKNEFGANSQESSLATDMKNAGDKTNAATYIGFEILTSIENKFEAQTSDNSLDPSNASLLTVALLQCMYTGVPTPPADTIFRNALRYTGAYGVRGLGGTFGTTSDTRTLFSHDSKWLIRPSDGSNWQDATTANDTITDPTLRDALLVYGRPGSSSGFSLDDPTGGVFEWATVPTASFSPDLIIGECFQDPSYMQHDSAGGSPEVLGFVDPGCPTTSGMAQPEPRSLAQRIIRFFEPTPLMATVLGTSGTGGSRGSLSPFGVVHPGKTLLQALFQWKTKSPKSYAVNTYLDPNLSYNVTTLHGTIFLQPYILVWLLATNNQGFPVAICNNYAYTNAKGLANLSHAYLNKAGGYTITTYIAGAFTLTVPNVGTVTIPEVPPQDPVNSPLINVQNKSVTAPDDCSLANIFTTPEYDQDGHITNPPPYPGGNPVLP